MSPEQKFDWARHFKIQSSVELDLVFQQKYDWPVGITRRTPKELHRRLLAAAVSYQLQLRSIDYTLRTYVNDLTLDDDSIAIGDKISDFISNALKTTKARLKELHTSEKFSFGQFGAEVTLFKLPETIDTARLLANRGLLLEAIPILRLCVEMLCWSKAVYNMSDESAIIALKPHACISKTKATYPSIGMFYGYLSKIAHWEQTIHGDFMHFEGDAISIVSASCKNRAMSLAICLTVIDILTEVVRAIYKDMASDLIFDVQGTLNRDKIRKTYVLTSEITELVQLPEFDQLRTLLPT